MITINGKTEFDYNANFIHFEVTPPEPKIEQITVPLRDGSINGSAILSSRVFYETRTVTIGLELRCLRRDWPMIYSQILEDFHGRQVEVERSEDPGWYWIGSAAVEELEDHGASAGVTITVNAQPFKRTRAKEIVYDGTLSGNLTLTPDVPFMRGYPIITTTVANVTVTCNGETWTLPEGESTVFGLTLYRGENEITVSGSGSLRIVYEGGAL